MVDTLQQRAARGAVLISGLSLFQRLVTLPASIVLARVLTPTDYGIYAITGFIVAFFSIFSNVGFGAALIQQNEPPSREDLTTTFTVQMALVCGLTAIGFLIAEPASQAYQLSEEGVWLIRVLLLSLPLSLLRTIPALLLERELRFGRVSIIEAVETFSFYGTAVTLALLDFGTWSFIWATIVRGALGVGVALVLSPWRPGIGFSRSVAERLIRFGLPYQLRLALTFFRDALTPTVLGLLLGAAAVGYINWAFAFALLPVLLTGPLGRVMFPAISRAQNDPSLLKNMIERSLRLSAIVFFPVSFLMIGAAPEIVRYIYTEKWAPALPAFYLFSVSIWPGALLATLAFNVFNGMGHSKLALYLIILYGALDWLIGVPLVLWLGFNGIAVGAALVAYIMVPVVARTLKRIVAVSIIPQTIRPFVTGACAALVEVGLLAVLPPGLLSLAVAMSCAALVYIGVIAVWEQTILRITLRRTLPLRFQGLFRWYLAPQD
ncbi:MAG TPA: oligosaccharide flippase family protein [Chloroflexia bacterium]|nr:oligosaccharide flippase family protein [Chloroflexia bacterium]